MEKDWETAFESAINSGQIPGVVLMARDTTGEKVNFTRCYGARTSRDDLDPSQRPALTVDTPLRLASLSKLITTVLALQCVEQGLLGLDEDVKTLLPELGDMKILKGFNADGDPELSDSKRPITLRNLLTHTSGISYIVEDANLIRYRDLGLIAKPVSGRVTERYKYPLIHEPGARWSYGPNLDWTGKLVERATGLSLEERLQQSICNPLGITDMTFKLQQHPDMIARRADMSKRGADGTPQNEDASYYHIDPEDCFGGMGIFASSEAFMLFLCSLLSRDGKLLKTETIELMCQPQLGPECEKSINNEIDARRETSHGGLLPPVGIKRNHGLGSLMIMEDCDGNYGRQKGSIGWGGYPNIYWVSIRSPSKGIT
ncbi:hypothetical protein DL768_007980 [Monosporascus sp. mg162]|nr:hypothetical protein DL768_007980 [Monosporascus sp. mg162]